MVHKCNRGTLSYYCHGRDFDHLPTAYLADKKKGFNTSDAFDRAIAIPARTRTEVNLMVWFKVRGKKIMYGPVWVRANEVLLLTVNLVQP